MSFTLDDLRDAAEAKYGNFVIGNVGPKGIDVELVNALRLKKEARKALQALEDASTNEDAEERMFETIRLIARTKAQADALLKELDGDLAVLALILEQYGSETQMGEA